MTDNDDPFGRRDRTIIRPKPRRPETPAGPPVAPGPPGGAPAASAPDRPVSHPEPSTPDATRVNLGGRLSSPAPRPPPGDPDPRVAASPAPMKLAQTSPHASIDLVNVGANPLLRAGSTLLLMLGRLRASLLRAGAGQLTDQVARAIQQFETDARAAGAPAEQVAAAKYALAATADDIVQNLPGDDRDVWTKNNMVLRFFGERTAGEKFFQVLEKAKQNPSADRDLLELMHACLSLGFEGAYRASGGAGALQRVRRDLYEAIRRSAPKTIEDLSPHWRGQDIALAVGRFQVPLWAVGAVAAAILFGVYLVLRNLLVTDAEALALTMTQIHPAAEITITRETVVKPPPDPKPRQSAQLDRIRAALADEILAGKVSADQTATSIIIRIRSFVLFPSGGAAANASFAPIAKKIALALDKEPGAIQIDGYTDSDPITTVAFASNFALSQARAKSVAAVLKPNLAKPDRVTVAGKGSDNPLAPNDIEANKSKNRRVEISIPRAD